MAAVSSRIDDSIFALISIGNLMMRIRLLIATSILWLSTVATAQQPATTTPALSPEPQASEWWMPRHEQKLREKEAMERVDLVWIGDSITHGWEGDGKQLWNEHFAPLHALNLGFSADRTEHVLWRLQHGAIDSISPQVAVVMIGTNNTGHRQDPAEETAAGVKAIIDELQARTPETKVLLLAIFPRGETADDPLRQLNAQINEILATYADGQRVFFQDINDVFLEEDGRLPKSIMPDLLHPNAEGYRRWAEAIQPTLTRLIMTDEGAAAERDAGEATTADGVTVRAVGTVRTGLVAIGGETTGTTIAAGDLELELDLGGRPELAAVAERLDGRRGIATGRLHRVRGVERGDRWIVKVRELRPVDQAAPIDQASPDESSR